MWWMPLIQFGANRIAEKKTREAAEQQQQHAIRSRLAAEFGAPSYGPDTALAQHELQRQIDKERRERNQQLLGDTLDEFNSGKEVHPADQDPDTAPPTKADRQRRGQDQARQLREQYEIERARRALQGLK